jgi:CheY-like chemotaxis protein
MEQARILIVEDEPMVASILKRRLEVLGYQIAGMVDNGTDAVASAGEVEPDIVLMDIFLPGGLDGIEAARRIREKYAIPVIYLTAFADDTVIQEAKLTQPFGYILKPFSDRDLYSTLEMALYRHRKRVYERQRKDSGFCMNRLLYLTVASMSAGLCRKSTGVGWNSSNTPGKKS